MGLFGGLGRFSLRRCLLWQILCFSLVLISVDFNAAEKTKKGKGKIKKKQPDDPFLPAMIVFNLDHTLWPFAMEYMQLPLETTSVKYQIRDHVGRLFNLFPDVYDILEDLDSNWYKIGGISDNSDIRTVEKTTDLFDIDKFFNALESKPGNKTEQMIRLSERAKVPLENILYFDTNRMDLDDMKAMNVTTVLLHPSGGITYAHLEEGFKVFKEQKQNETMTTTSKP